MCAVVRGGFLRQREAGAPGPLPSWHEGPNKAAIIKRVLVTTTAGGADFVPVDERIATFDNDGPASRARKP